MSATVTFNGWGEFQSKLKSLPQVLFDEIDGECEDAANEWEELAKNAAPKDQGFLSQNINNYQVGMMHYEVTSGSEISAIAEWGTGSRVKVPSDLQEYASQFKGKPEDGTAEGALKNITAWVKRKGIRFDSAATYKSGKRKGQNKQLNAQTTAKFIFHFIMLHGVRPHPYFFVQQPIVEKNLVERIDKNIMKREH